MGLEATWVTGRDYWALNRNGKANGERSKNLGGSYPLRSVDGSISIDGEWQTVNTLLSAHCLLLRRRMETSKRDAKAGCFQPSPAKQNQAAPGKMIVFASSRSARKAGQWAMRKYQRVFEKLAQ